MVSRLSLTGTMLILCGLHPGPWTGSCDGEPWQITVRDSHLPGHEPWGVVAVQCGELAAARVDTSAWTPGPCEVEPRGRE